MAHHDHEAYEVFIYSNTKESDGATETFKRRADHWRDVARMSDGEFREAVRADHLDILIDLAGHTEGGRPKAIGERLAPVQVSYLGYPGTTGIEAMDYRLTDEWADPAGSEAHYTERLFRLSGGFLCYSPIFTAPSVGPLPAAKNGYVTFGSFNNIAKLSLPAIALWARILRAIPGSRLRLKSKPLADAAVRQRIQRLFAQNGIPGDRLLFDGWVPSSGEHLAQYASVDIAIDPFPYNGTTTTCEALWMGVPVVTLAGERHSGRVGVSLLSGAGLPELIADSEESYLEIACRLANELPRLAELRATLRSRMRDSPLCDAPRITREIESAGREMIARYRTS
jgi:predicted O-linked N-acetylglucosamine transferase (SPINDLY family)